MLVRLSQQVAKCKYAIQPLGCISTLYLFIKLSKYLSLSLSIYLSVLVSVTHIDKFFPQKKNKCRAQLKVI